MAFHILAFICFFSAALVIGACAFQSLRLAFRPAWAVALWSKWGSRSRRFYACWFGLYACFVVFGTGPSASDAYPPSRGSPYRLPWRAGTSRLVIQGNRSFVSHRGAHLYAYDFWMPVGTEIVAARDGVVTRIEDDHDGIGALSNYVRIEHSDGTSAMYAHIRRAGATVKRGERVRQGQLVAYSGMVGQTLYPHLHFVVVGPHEEPQPVTFLDVEGEIPLAGRSYLSGNVATGAFHGER